MRNRAISPVATILSVLLLVFAATSAQAGPVAYSEVVHVMGNVRNGGQSQELRLRSISQDGSTLVKGTVSSDGKSSSASTDTSSGPLSLISTNPGLQEGQQGSVEVIEEGDVTGTVCDCGEIFIPGGGFPKWLALGAVPLVCVLIDCTPDDNECEGPDCNPCVGPDCNPCVGPDCNPPEIPEPATIFLLGSGLAALGAKARRRYTQSRTDNADNPKV